MRLKKVKKIINKKFLHTTIISNFLIFLSKIFTVLSTLLIFRLLSISEAGYYFYLLSIFSMLASVVQFGHGYALIDYFSNKKIKKGTPPPKALSHVPPWSCHMSPHHHHGPFKHTLELLEL